MDSSDGQDDLPVDLVPGDALGGIGDIDPWQDRVDRSVQAVLSHELDQPREHRAAFGARCDELAEPEALQASAEGGSVPDLDVRADVGPALIVMQLVTRGSPPDESEIRSVILPLMLAGTPAT